MRRSTAAFLTCAALALSIPAAPAAALGGDGTGEDCNGNQVPDDIDILDGTSTDCNANGIPDECDIADGTSMDCNGDGLPDECPACPPVEIVFVMDTSGSMSDESLALCAGLDTVQASLASLGITTSVTILGITEGASTDFPCLIGSVAALVGTTVPGTGDTLNDLEDWGPATAIVAQDYPWIPGAVRVVVPISDEGAENGDPCSDPGPDRDAVVNAAFIANQNDVAVSPIAGTGSDACVTTLMSDLADATGGTWFLSTDPATDLVNGILDLVLAACQGNTDCNENGIPDECEPDCNGNGIPDDCDGGCPPVDLDCDEFDRIDPLTARDTRSVITNFHNPEQEQGYVYAYAVDGAGVPIGHDWLIGQMLIVNGLETFEYSTNAFDYRAAVGQGVPTDFDGDGIRDLDGLEYERTAGEVLVPRFIGQNPGFNQSELILIGLSGGTSFVTTLDLLIYNDNEVAFSSELTFRCWDKLKLLQISGVFDNGFLMNASGDDPDEGLGGRETGWIRLDGDVATSDVLTITDPAFQAVYVERIGSYAAADLPFERCLQRGSLLPDDPFGDDDDQASGGAATQSCDTSIGRRGPGSLLVFPEFDNLAGVVSILTVTNSAQFENTRVHFHYIGRFGN